MEQTTNRVMFALLRSAIAETKLSDSDKAQISEEMLHNLFALSAKHDIAHMIGAGLEKNALLKKGEKYSDLFFREIFKAVYRFEQQNYELNRLCAELEKAEIHFIPLKGSVLRGHYKNPWMRTSCDIDILVKIEDIDRAIDCLVQNCGYECGIKSSHDVSLYSKTKVHIELHYDLIEDGRVTAVFDVLQNVWKYTVIKDGYKYYHEMTDEMFYFYHIAHMAKHFTVGGCGIKPFVDLWILDHINGTSHDKRSELLKKGDLLVFSETVRALNRVWFEDMETTQTLKRVESFILQGGVFGTFESKTMAVQRKKGKKREALIKTIFLPYEQMKIIYPILERHKWLLPFAEVRRWFVKAFTKSGKEGRAKVKFAMNVDSKASSDFFNDIGLK